MLRYSSQVSWMLIVAFTLSLLYQLYRSTAKNGTSRYDSSSPWRRHPDHTGAQEAACPPIYGFTDI
jgi:hypothetical protein